FSLIPSFDVSESVVFSSRNSRRIIRSSLACSVVGLRVLTIY
ncbi:1165_t:CDS:1, partial [Ambispora gerdemannii]